MIYWFLMPIGGLVLLLVLAGVVLYILGSRLPITHTASHAVELAVPPEKVFAILADFQGMKNWPDSGITAIEPLPDENGLPVVRQRMGRNSFVLRTTRFDPPRELQRTISDDHQFFGGSWIYVIDPAPGGSRVTLTEEGTVKAAIPRAVMHYLTGEDYYLKKHLASLQAFAR